MGEETREDLLQRKQAGLDKLVHFSAPFLVEEDRQVHPLDAKIEVQRVWIL